MALNEKEKAIIELIKKQINEEPFYGDQYSDRAKETHDWSAILKADTLDTKVLHTLIKKEIIIAEPSRQGNIYTIKKGKKW